MLTDGYSGYRDSETYTNELAIEIDFSRVDKKLLQKETPKEEINMEQENPVNEGLAALIEKFKLVNLKILKNR